MTRRQIGFLVLGTGHLHSCVHTSKVSQLTGIVFFEVFSCGSYQKMLSAAHRTWGRHLPKLAQKADIIMAAKYAQSVINASNHLPRKHSPACRSPKDSICWYHAKFGNKAKACRPPCLFSSSAKHCLSNWGNDQAST